MTYKHRKYRSEAWLRHQKRIQKRFMIECTIALMLVIAGTTLGCWLSRINFTGMLNNVRIMIFGG